MYIRNIAMSNLRFHNRTGSMVTLSSSNKTAERNEPHREFNNGLVVSNEPLKDDHVFAVKIDRKVSSWSGSIEIGMTTFEPTRLDFPSSATNLRQGAWVMSGTSILKDGKSIFDECPDDLDELLEGDVVGVMKSSSGTLHFFINGVDQGFVEDMKTTSPVYAVIDLYGKCAKVSIIEPSDTATQRRISISNRTSEMLASNNPQTTSAVEARTEPEQTNLRLQFHHRSGTMVQLSNDNRTAERRYPADEFNNAVTMTCRPLKDNELFQIQIDKLIHKWSGSIEMGVTTHNPDVLDFPATMTNMRSGTIMMSGCGILTNGKGSKREYGDFNLDELRAGDRIGLMRKSNGNLHYYINGLDQGIAAANIPSIVYGVVDLYGMTVKVSLNDNMSTGGAFNHCARTRIALAQTQNYNANPNSHTEQLIFHQRCGDHVTIINGGRTAIRPNCLDDFNQAVVLTNRPLRQGEFFQVIIEEVVTKWAGSIEIGVTTHNPHELFFPPTMTLVRTGTWMMTGSGIMYNGTTIIDVYGHSLDKLKAGDRVGLVVSNHGKLHFFINGVDQGLAACNVPNGVYGVMDLYGQAAKASIVQNSANTPNDEAGPSSSSNYQDNWFLRNTGHCTGSKRPFSQHLGKEAVGLLNESFKSGNITKDPDGLLHYFRDEQSGFNNTPSDAAYIFHKTCGKNVVFKCGGNMAIRKKSFKNGLLFSSKPIEDEGYFEVQIVTVNPRLHGSITVGLTDFEPLYSHYVPEFAIDFKHYRTWLLHGNDFYRDGQIVRTNYAHGFWRATAGDKIGVRKDLKGCLYFSLNGREYGVAAKNLPVNLHVVCDLFGSTEAVRISQTNLPRTSIPKDDSLTFHIRHDRNIKLTNDRKTAIRICGHKNSVVMTNRSLKPGELFEVNIDTIVPDWPTSLRIGVSNRAPEKWHRSLNDIPVDECSWLIVRNQVVHKKKVVLSKYGPDLSTLKDGQTLGVMVDATNKLHLYIDGKDQGVAVDGLSFPCYGFVDLFGQCSQISFPEIKHLEKAAEENKEKTEAENDKESVCEMFETLQVEEKICPFLTTCSKIRQLLFPDGFFLLDQIACFCDECHRARGEETVHKKGDPPKDYAQPIGWCRFGLRNKYPDKSFQEKWHVAFHGSKLMNVRKTLDNKCLLSQEKLSFQYSNCSMNNEDPISSHVLMSPTIRYAGCSRFAPKAKITDPATMKDLHFHAAFQVFVRPGSYTIANQQLAMNEPLDDHFKNSDLEWYTKEEGATILHGLLIRLAD